MLIIKSLQYYNISNFTDKIVGYASFIDKHAKINKIGGFMKQLEFFSSIVNVNTISPVTLKESFKMDSMSFSSSMNIPYSICDFISKLSGRLLEESIYNGRHPKIYTCCSIYHVLFQCVYLETLCSTCYIGNVNNFFSHCNDINIRHNKSSTFL